MVDHLHDVKELQHEGRNSSVQAFGKYQLGLDEHFPTISVLTEPLPHGLIADEM
ncbi:hypothetical protein [Massilia sp. BSC265]|uniref:hypothetical protein n=1 Tax=Massilia sp. BSC265 TaxID=1549812 RepID=UPI0013779B8D|nr:hypothetical protein [Massilia sp. BSC265]